MQRCLVDRMHHACTSISGKHLGEITPDLGFVVNDESNFEERKVPAPEESDNGVRAGG